MRMKGFTLIELLVVITIIVILLTVLLPALVLAREHVYSAVCLHRLKDIGLAIHQYANDNQDRVIPMNLVDWRYRDRETNYKWYTNVFDTGSYIRTAFRDPEIGDPCNSIFSTWYCPSVKPEERGWGAGIAFPEFNHPYPLLSKLRGKPLPRLDSIRHPSDACSAADGRERNGSKWVTAIGIYPPIAQDLPSWEEGGKQVAPRHPNGANIGRFDGSAQTYDFEFCNRNYRNMFGEDLDGDGICDF